MILFCIPALPALLNTTRINPSAPGATGSLGYSGIVHPQVAVALLIIRGLFPIFLNLKSYVTFSPSLISPKSYTSFSNLNTGALVVSAVATVASS